MPMYDYRCDSCGHADDEFFKMGNAEPTMTCPKCGQFAYRKQVTAPHTDLKEFHTPIEMHSIGLHDDEEIREFRRRCPDVEVCDDPNSDLYGTPIARNRKQKLAALAAVGFEERN